MPGGGAAQAWFIATSSSANSSSGMAFHTSGTGAQGHADEESSWQGSHEGSCTFMQGHDHAGTLPNALHTSMAPGMHLHGSQLRGLCQHAKVSASPGAAYVTESRYADITLYTGMTLDLCWVLCMLMDPQSSRLPRPMHASPGHPALPAATMNYPTRMSDTYMGHRVLRLVERQRSQRERDLAKADSTINCKAKCLILHTVPPS